MENRLVSTKFALSLLGVTPVFASAMAPLQIPLVVGDTIDGNTPDMVERYGWGFIMRMVQSDGVLPIRWGSITRLYG